MAATVMMTGRGGWPMSCFLDARETPTRSGAAPTSLPNPSPTWATCPRSREILETSAASGGTQNPAGAAAGRCKSRHAVREQLAHAATACPSARHQAERAVDNAARARSIESNLGGFGSNATSSRQPVYRSNSCSAARDGSRRCPRRSLPSTRRSSTTLDQHGHRRHVRPDRRRLPSLQHRRDLDRAALREDALRPGPAREPSTPARGRSTTIRLLQAHCQRDLRLRHPRDVRPLRAGCSAPRTPRSTTARGSTISGRPSRSAK